MRNYKIAEARIAKGWTQSDLAKMIGTTQQQIARYESGDNDVKSSVLMKLSSALGVTISYLLGLEGADEVKEDGYTDVPLLGSIAAGQPVDMESADGSFPIPTVIHDRYPRAFLLRVDGSSMDRHLPNGSLALVDPDDAEPDGRSAYAVCVNGYAATIKRVNRLANGIELVPDSHDPTQRPIVFDYADEDAEEVTVIGKVVWATMPFDYEI